MTEWRNDEHSTLYIQIFTYCKASKNQEPKKQETKNWFCEKLQKVKMKKEVGNLNLHQKVPIWTLFYYFILTVQKLNFPPGWILQCPFCFVTFHFIQLLFSLIYFLSQGEQTCGTEIQKLILQNVLTVWNVQNNEILVSTCSRTDEKWPLMNEYLKISIYTKYFSLKTFSTIWRRTLKR